MSTSEKLRRRLSRHEVAWAARRRRDLDGTLDAYLDGDAPLQQRCPWCLTTVPARDLPPELPDEPWSTEDITAVAGAHLDDAVHEHLRYDCPAAPDDRRQR